MNLSDAKRRLSEIEDELPYYALVEFGTFDTLQGKLVVFITEYLYHSCHRGKVWKSKSMLSALKNAEYGLRTDHPRSRGGADGIFLLDRDFKPPNEMIKKIFDRFLDKPDPLVSVLVSILRVSPNEFIPVRVVSLHMRLLGVLVHSEDRDNLILVDYDDTKSTQ